MKRILFQGDSITDAGRLEDKFSGLGLGYPAKVASKLGVDNPGKFEFINRGISGNRIIDLYARIKCDIINLEPDFLSIMIGVNDVWHELESKDGIAIPKYEILYNMLLDEVTQALPDLKIMLIEPYVLPECGTVGIMADGKEKYDIFRQDIEEMAKIVQKLARKYDLAFVPLQKKLDELSKVQPVAYWIRDGVHPTNIGHEVIAQEWIECFNNL